MSSPLCSLHWLHLKAVASEALPLSFFENLLTAAGKLKLSEKILKNFLTVSHPMTETVRG